MWHKVVFFGRILLLLAILLGLSQTMASAAPQDICISTPTGGFWEDTATWLVCTGAKPPAITDDVYIQGPVFVVAPHTAANVTISAGGSIATTGIFFTANNMIIDAGGTFIGSLMLSGNLTNNGTFTAGGADTDVFSGASVQTISSASDLAFNNLTINNAAGVTLNRNASVAGTLTLTSGDLLMGSNTLDLTGASIGGFGSGDVVGMTTRGSGSMAASTPYAFNSPNTIVTFGSAGTLPTALSVNLTKSAPGGLANAVQRYYSISPTGGSGYNFTLRLHYLDSELNGIDETKLSLWELIGGRWTLRSATTRNSTNNWVESTGLTSFSQWGLSDSGAPTAVTLSSMKASAPSFDLGAWLTNLFSR